MLSDLRGLPSAPYREHRFSQRWLSCPCAKGESTSAAHSQPLRQDESFDHWVPNNRARPDRSIHPGEPGSCGTCFFGGTVAVVEQPAGAGGFACRVDKMRNVETPATGETAGPTRVWKFQTRVWRTVPVSQQYTERIQLVVEDFESMAPVILNPSRVPMTDEEFVSFCQQYEDRFVECTAEGEIIIMPPNFSRTGEQNSDIIAQLVMWAKKDGRGRVYDSSAGFRLPNCARRSPDASWIRKDRVAALPKKTAERFLPPVSRLRHRAPLAHRPNQQAQGEDGRIHGQWR